MHYLWQTVACPCTCQIFLPRVEYEHFDDDDVVVAASQDYEKLLHCSEGDNGLSADEFLDDQLTQEDVERFAPLLK